MTSGLEMRDIEKVAEDLTKILKPMGWGAVWFADDLDELLFLSPDGIGFSWYPDFGCTFGDLNEIFWSPSSLDNFISTITGPKFREGLAGKYLKSDFYENIAQQIDEWTHENPILKKALYSYIPADQIQTLSKKILIGSPTEEEIRSVYGAISNRQVGNHSYIEDPWVRNKWYAIILSRLKRD